MLIRRTPFLQYWHSYIQIELFNCHVLFKVSNSTCPVQSPVSCSSDELKPWNSCGMRGDSIIHTSIRQRKSGWLGEGVCVCAYAVDTGLYTRMWKCVYERDRVCVWKPWVILLSLAAGGASLSSVTVWRAGWGFNTRTTVSCRIHT